MGLGRAIGRCRGKTRTDAQDTAYGNDVGVRIRHVGSVGFDRDGPIRIQGCAAPNIGIHIGISRCRGNRTLPVEDPAARGIGHSGGSLS